MTDEVFSGTIPDHWRRYKVHKAMGASEWISNFARRLGQLDQIATLDNLNNVEVWLGGLFFPEAYITATRQAVAHRKRWSLETLRLELDIEKVNDPGAFIVDGKSHLSTALRYHSHASDRSRARGCRLGNRQAGAERRRDCPPWAITSPLGTVGRGGAGQGEPAGVPQRRPQRRHVHG